MTDLTLTDTEQKLMRIWSKSWTYLGAMETEIREQTGLSKTQATQIINRLIDTEAALAFDPLTTKRLQRLRSQRQLSRSAARTAR